MQSYAANNVTLTLNFFLIIPNDSFIFRKSKMLIRKYSSRPKTSGAVLGGSLHARAPESPPNAENMGKYSGKCWVYSEYTELLLPEGTWISSWSSWPWSSWIRGRWWQCLRWQTDIGFYTRPLLRASASVAHWNVIRFHASFQGVAEVTNLEHKADGWGYGLDLFTSPHFALFADDPERSQKQTRLERIGKVRLRVSPCFSVFQKCFRARNPRRMKPFRCRHLLGLPWRDWYLWIPLSAGSLDQSIGWNEKIQR